MQFPTIPSKLPTISKFNRLSKKHKITTAGAVAATALVLTVTGLEATAGAGSATAEGNPTGFSVSAGQQVKALGANSGMASQGAIHGADKKQQDAKQKVAEALAGKQAPATPAADAHATRSVPVAVHPKPAAKAAHPKAPAKAVHAKAVHPHKAAHAKKPAAHAAPKHTTKYPNNLDGWIRQSLAIMHQKGIPGSYSGIHRNIIRESSGNPNAINLWDINAQNGIPSKGLLQVINPTFDRYHVSGTSWNIYNPVANITAACNYAADRYGSMDNVNSAY